MSTPKITAIQIGMIQYFVGEIQNHSVTKTYRHK